MQKVQENYGGGSVKNKYPYGNRLSFDEAQQKVRDMKAALKNPKGWRTLIHENMGWHACLRKGAMSLYYSNGEFHVLFGSEPSSHGGESFWSTHHYYHKNPEKVIEDQLRAANKFVATCTKAISAVEAA